MVSIYSIWSPDIFAVDLCSRRSLRGLIALIASVTPRCPQGYRVSLTTKTCHFLGKWPKGLAVPSCSVLFSVASPTTHSRRNNKSTSDNGAPKQRSWNALTTGRPLALSTLPSHRPALSALWLHLHAGRKMIWSCSWHTYEDECVLLWDLMSCACWLWHLSIEDIHYSVTSCYSAPVALMSLLCNCQLNDLSWGCCRFLFKHFMFYIVLFFARCKRQTQFHWDICLILNFSSVKESGAPTWYAKLKKGFHIYRSLLLHCIYKTPNCRG